MIKASSAVACFLALACPASAQTGGGGGGSMGPAVPFVPAVTSSPSSPASTIDFTAKLTGVGGKPLMIPGDDCKPRQVPGSDCSEVQATLGDVAIKALENPVDGDVGEDPMKRFKRDVLARKIYDNKSAALSPEEVATIKERVGKYWINAGFVGAAWPLLDPTLK